MGSCVVEPAGVCKRVFAWVHAHCISKYDKHLTEHRRRLLSGVQGDVLEIGPGTGINLAYYPPGIRWTGVEPNPFMHPYLMKEAGKLGLGVTLRRAAAEQLDFADGAFDAVVATHVLCSVSDPARVVAEIKRVLKPGGRFCFIEHVAAPPRSRQRRLQGFVRPIWRRLADGCYPDRDTEELVRHAGFARLNCTRLTLPYMVVGPHLIGTATK
ncbi:MAG: class I SAM-dependent methyltransferase [Planctomycetota bacterium]